VNELGQNTLFVCDCTVKPVICNQIKKNQQVYTKQHHQSRSKMTEIAAISQSQRLMPQTNVSYTTPIHSLEFVVLHGIDVTHTDCYGCTPIIHLLLHFPYSELLCEKLVFLFESGVDIKHVCPQKNTALSLLESLALDNITHFQPIVQLVQSMIQKTSNTPNNICKPTCPHTCKDVEKYWHLPSFLL